MFEPVNRHEPQPDRLVKPPDPSLSGLLFFEGYDESGVVAVAARRKLDQLAEISGNALCCLLNAARTRRQHDRSRARRMNKTLKSSESLPKIGWMNTVVSWLQHSVPRRTHIAVGAVLVMFLWALCFPLIHYGLSASPPMTFAALRALIAGGVLLGIAQWQGRAPIRTARLWGSVVLAGFTATSLGFFGMFYGGGAIDCRQCAAGITGLLGRKRHCHRLVVAVRCNSAYAECGSTAAAFILWFWLLQHATLSRLNVYTFLTPVFGLMMGAAFFSEQIPPIALIGVVVSIAGIYWVNKADVSPPSTLVRAESARPVE